MTNKLFSEFIEGVNESAKWVEDIFWCDGYEKLAIKYSPKYNYELHKIIVVIRTTPRLQNNQIHVTLLLDYSGKPGDENLGTGYFIPINEYKSDWQGIELKPQVSIMKDKTYWINIECNHKPLGLMSADSKTSKECDVLVKHIPDTNWKSLGRDDDNNYHKKFLIKFYGKYLP